MKRIVTIAGVLSFVLVSALLFAQEPGRDGARGAGARGANSQTGQGERGNGAGGARGGRGNQGKAENVPAGLFTEKRFATMPTQRHEIVDIPAGSAKLHTWISYPPGEDKAGVVVLLAHEPGLDYWMRAAADQVAHDGFIAVATDVLTGKGPNGGGTDAFDFPDEAIRADAKVTAAEALRDYKAALDYGMKLPRANGKSAFLGFSIGGTHAYRLAANTPSVGALVIFYAGAPGDVLLGKINAPVLGLYGDLDSQVTPAAVQATADTMKRLGKSFDSGVYPHATNFFLIYQDMAQNGMATQMAWPRAMTFLRDHLQ